MYSSIQHGVHHENKTGNDLECGSVVIDKLPPHNVFASQSDPIKISSGYVAPSCPTMITSGQDVDHGNAKHEALTTIVDSPTIYSKVFNPHLLAELSNKSHNTKQKSSK